MRMLKRIVNSRMMSASNFLVERSVCLHGGYDYHSTKLGNIHPDGRVLPRWWRCAASDSIAVRGHRRLWDRSERLPAPGLRSSGEMLAGCAAKDRND